MDKESRLDIVNLLYSPLSAGTDTIQTGTGGSEASTACIYASFGCRKAQYRLRGVEGWSMFVAP